MNITFNSLRKIKHSLPTGSISKIASELNLEEQTVRNYFGAKKYTQGGVAEVHVQPGPDGGIVNIDDTTILDAANKILAEVETSAN